MAASDDEIREALTSNAYRSAYEKAMRGDADGFTDDERTAVLRARELTGTHGPGYPVPAGIDPTRGGTPR